MTSKVLALAGASALVAAAAVAQAQPTPAPRPATPPPAAARPAAAAAPAMSHGPAINGMCMLAIDQAIQQSTVGRYVGTRMQQIVAQVKAELQPDETAITTEGRALEQSRATLDAATYQSRVANLNLRIANYQKKGELRQREVEATEQKALNRIAQELDPIVRQVYQQRGCSLLLNRQAVLVGNPAMDVTPMAITALNAKITQFTFDRERLDAAQAPAAAASPR